MPTRIKANRRRYARGNDVVAAQPATHVIKIGWKGKSQRGAEIPIKLNGFLVCRDDVDPSGKRMLIDYAAMQRLGSDPQKIKTAIEKHWNAPDDCLPRKLEFILMSDAKRDGEEGDWIYPGIVAEGYQCYGKKGLFCFGDGQGAWRKQADGSRKNIACVPVGQEGADPSTYCEYSTRGECRYNYRLTVCLLYRDGQGHLRPVSPELGESALYRLDSTSEFSGPEVMRVLDAAADRVDGHLNGITGTLTFQRKRRRTKESQAIVGHVLFQLDEASIRAREQLLAANDERNWNRQLEAADRGIALIEHRPTHAPIDVEPEPEQVAEVEPEPAPADPPPAAPEPQPQNEPGIDLSAIDDEDMVDRLNLWACESGEARERTAGAVLREIACQVFPKISKVAEEIHDAEWFVKGKGEGDKHRRAALHAIVACLIEDGSLRIDEFGGES